MFATGLTPLRQNLCPKGAYDENRKIHLVRDYTTLYHRCQGLLIEPNPASCRVQDEVNLWCWIARITCDCGVPLHTNPHV